MSTIAAIVRECSYLQFTPTGISVWAIVPPFGAVVLIVLYLGFIIALEFINNDHPGAQYNQALGIRAGWLAVAQVPLLILLAGKKNFIGLLTGVNYTRLVIYHR